MIVNENQTRNWTAVSAIKPAGTEKWVPILYMNASFNGKDLSYNKSIQNWELYEENKDVAAADYTEFERKVEEDMGK